MEQPHVRDNIRFFLSCLSDYNYQKKHWTIQTEDESVVTLHDIVHFLFDDTILHDNPDGCIGVCLKNLSEADAIRAVTSAIVELTDHHGKGQSDAYYISTPEWQTVASSAKAALQLIADKCLM